MRQKDLWLGHLYSLSLVEHLKEEKIDHILTLSKVYRHDTLNSMQIVWGWIQLDKPEKAIDYIKEWQLEVVRQSEIVKGLHEHLAVWFIQSQAQAAIEGVRLRYIGEPLSLKLDIPYFTDLLNLVIESLLELLKTLTSERDIFWCIEEHNKYMVFFIPNLKLVKSDVDPIVEKLKLDDNVFIKSLVWEEESKAIAKWFGYLVNLDTEEKWICEGKQMSGVMVRIKLVRSEDSVY